jgi:hypothetical protein
MGMQVTGFLLLLSLVVNVVFLKSSTVTAITLDLTPAASGYGTGFNE